MSAYRRFIFCSDIHGDEQDYAACEVAFKFKDIFKPDISICGGDLWNFSPLRKGASADEQRVSLKNDFTAGVKWFNRFKPTHFLRGNHDERIFELAQYGCGVAADFAGEKLSAIKKMVAKHRCDMRPYHKSRGILSLSGLNFLHGFNCGLSAARQTALFYGSSVFGHCHNDDQQSVGGLEKRTATCASCLCNLDMDFEARKPNSLRHGHGFVYGLLHKTQPIYHVWQARSIAGTWLIPSDIVEL